jgi:hypothetical protein
MASVRPAAAREARDGQRSAKRGSFGVATGTRAAVLLDRPTSGPSAVEEMGPGGPIEVSSSFLSRGRFRTFRDRESDAISPDHVSRKALEGRGGAAGS